ncbi:MAG: 23S rRNA (guanosine(2251)-2'-O)-methyltransferase RlmB [Bacteroidota bacterium]
MNEMIAGRNPVIEALRSGSPIEKVVVLFGVRGSAIDRIRELARQNSVPLVEVNKQKFRELVNDTTTQGVVALVGTTEYVSVDALLSSAKERQQQPFLLVLDEIQDPQNLGAIIRTAECAGAHGVIVAKHHSATVNQTVARASAGASEQLPIAKVTNIATTLDELKKQGLWIVGADVGGDKLYYELDYKTPIAIVVGNEGEGIRRLVKEKCDFLVRIPLLGNIGSLNASVAAALVMYEVVRARNGNHQHVVSSN